MSCVRMSAQMSIPLTFVLLLAGAAWLCGCGENAVGQSETKAPGIERTQEGKWSYMVVEFELPKIDDNTWRVGAAATLAFTTQMNGLAGHGWEYVGPVNDAHVLPQHGLYYVAFRRLKNGPGANFARAWLSFVCASRTFSSARATRFRETISLSRSRSSFVRTLVFFLTSSMMSGSDGASACAPNPPPTATGCFSASFWMAANFAASSRVFFIDT